MNRFSIVKFSILLLIISCNREINNQDLSFKSKRVGSISFPLDSLTSFNNHFQVTNQDGRDLLFMLTAFNNRFVVYDIKTQELIKSFEFQSDPKDPISIGSIPPSGFNYINVDSVILYDFSKQKIFLGNEKGDTELLINLIEKFPSERDNWGAAYQGAEPLFINDSIISVTSSVYTGTEPLQSEQKTDLLINLNRNEVSKVNVLPGAYIPGNYYMQSRLRPTRVLDKRRGLLYYNYQNSDSLYILDFTTGERNTFFASHIDRLPAIETSDFNEISSYLSGFDNQSLYNLSQGTFLAVYYNPYRDQIIRLGYPGIADFNIQDYKDGLYKDEKILSFYDAKSHEFLGNIIIEGLGYDFMFFDETNFYMAEILLNKSEDELVFTKFKYPDF